MTNNCIIEIKNVTKEFNEDIKTLCDTVCQLDHGKLLEKD